MALRWLALMCCACGRIGFAPSDAADDGPVPVIAAAQATGNSTTAAAIQAVFSAPVQDHDAIILCFTFPHGSATLLSMTDTLANTYAIVIGPVVTNGLDHYVAFASSSPAGSDTVTVTLSAAISGGWEILALEYTGLAAFNVDTYDSGTSGSAMSSGSVTTTSAHELLLAYGHSTNPMAGPGYTMRASRSQSLVEDTVVFTTGTYTATGTTTPGIWTLILATFAGY